MISVNRSKSRSKTAPWSAQQPYLKQIYSQAQDLYGQGPYQYYGGSTVAGFDPASQGAFGRALNRSAAGSEGVRQAQDEQMRTSRGDYLDPESNPWLTKSYDLAARDMGRNYYGQVNALGSRMEGAGRTPGTSQQDVLREGYARGLGQLGADIYGGAYQFERGQQARAGGMAGQLADYDYRDIDAARSVGMQREQQAQAQLSDLVARFEQGQRGGAEKLAEFYQMLGGQPVMESNAKSSSFGMGIMSCWAAAELFGWFTPKFMAARHWLLEQWEGDQADAFRAFYEASGYDLAREIACDAEVRAQWLPFFEWAAAEGEAA